MIYSTESLDLNSSLTKVFSSKDFSGSELFFALEQLEKLNCDVNSIMTESYSKAIDSNTPLHESLDIGSILEKIIHKFIEMIKSIFNHFKAFIIKYANSDSIIKRNKDKIRRFDDVIEVDFDRYLYTCTDKNIPKCDFAFQFDRELDNLRNQLKPLSTMKNKAERIDTMNQIYNSIRNDVSEQYYEKVRATCIGVMYPISEDKFSNELFNVFRNGGEYYTCKINRNEALEVMDRFENCKDLIKDADKMKSDICTSANNIVKKIKHITLSSQAPSYLPYDVSEEEAFDRIRKTKIDQIKRVSQIFVLAFAAKIDALKESVSQDKKVLNEILYFMEANGL